MVDGPFTRLEAAERCRCKPDELCPGPLAGIDESDKIRTIYDGSKGGANAHIQAHTEEKTTAPMVGDCLHAIHWLRTAADHPHLLEPHSRARRRDLGMITSRCMGSPQVPRALRGNRAAPTCPPEPRGLNGAGGRWRPPTAGTPLRGRHLQGRGHSQVPRALIGGPHSPQPPLARNARGEAGGNP